MGEPRQLQLVPQGQTTNYKVKACYLAQEGVAGFRSVALNRTEVGYKIAGFAPTKFILLSDVETGIFFAIIDEQWIHAIRTGACAAVAADDLTSTRTPVVGIAGSGYMAKTSLMALAAVFDIPKVRVYSRTLDNAKKFARWAQEELSLDVVAVSTPKEAVEESDVVISATTTTTPFLQTEWFKKGSFFYSMGQHQEVDDSAYMEMKFIAEDWEQIQIKSDIKRLLKETSFSDEHVYAELADIASKKKPGRENPNERIFVRSQGLVTQDIATAYWVYKKAEEQGLSKVMFDWSEHLPMS
ncbi:hypothetical protein CV093_05075 [Oceanobacillus sp. 143]|nr:hypothetical protein CV093_05075 [Oceanobacillus sp. 143]